MAPRRGHGDSPGQVCECGQGEAEAGGAVGPGQRQEQVVAARHPQDQDGIEAALPLRAHRLCCAVRARRDGRCQAYAGALPRPQTPLLRRHSRPPAHTPPADCHMCQMCVSGGYALQEPLHAFRAGMEARDLPRGSAGAGLVSVSPGSRPEGLVGGVAQHGTRERLELEGGCHLRVCGGRQRWEQAGRRRSQSGGQGSATAGRALCARAGEREWRQGPGRYCVR